LDGGRKVLIRDCNLNVFKSPAKADPEGGIVESVCEKALSRINIFI